VEGAAISFHSLDGSAEGEEVREVGGYDIEF
jgi:hypothetical protein